MTTTGEVKVRRVCAVGSVGLSALPKCPVPKCRVRKCKVPKCPVPKCSVPKRPVRKCRGLPIGRANRFVYVDRG